MPRGYGADLAYIHDTGHGDFARRAAPWLLRMLRGAGIERGLVTDLGCGSGIWARELTGAGYDVFGVDQSREMLRIARRRAPRARFKRASFLGVTLPACVAVTALGEVFNYRFGPANDAGMLPRLFARVHAALEPGGLFIFDVATPGRGGFATRQKNVHGRDWAILLETSEHARRRELVRRIVSFRRVGKLYRRSEEVHTLRLYRPTDVARELRRAGFTVRLVRGYSAVRFPIGWTGFVARKRVEFSSAAGARGVRS